MRRYLLTCLLGALCYSAFAQKKDYVSLSVMTAFPVGSFAKKDAPYPTAINGYAKIGVGADLSYVHRSHPGHFGFAASLRARQNRIDTAAIFFSNREPDPYYTGRQPFVWTKTEEKWSLQSVMVGGYYGKPLSQKALFHAKVLTGVAHASFPEINWTAVVSPSYPYFATFKRERCAALTLSSCVSAGIEYQLTQKLSLVAAGEYWYAKPTFKDIKQEYTEMYGTTFMGGSIIETFAVDISTVNLTAGLAFSL